MTTNEFSDDRDDLSCSEKVDPYRGIPDSGVASVEVSEASDAIARMVKL